MMDIVDDYHLFKVLRERLDYGEDDLVEVSIEERSILRILIDFLKDI